MTGRPMLTHAENHSAYMARPGDTSLSRALQVAAQINETKVTDPATGEKINDGLVDSLIRNLRQVAKARPEETAEDPRWSAAQRCVWRYAAPRGNPMPYDRRLEIVNDRRVSPDMKALASVNGGRWLVTCPFPGCNSAQMACFEDRRFWCVDCANGAVGGKWIEVVWPNDPNAVELALTNRPESAKHWVPGESSEDIAEQDAVAMGRSHISDPDGAKGTFMSRREVEPLLHDPNTFPKTTMFEGKEIPVLHYGTPEWDKSQKDVI